jgi:hypothetical protein
MTLQTISNYLQMAGSLILVISCLPSWRSRATYIKCIGIYAIMSLSLSLTQVLFLEVGVNVNVIGNVYTLAEVLLLASVYITATTSARFGRVIGLLAGLYVVIYFGILIFFSDHFFSLVRFGRDFVMIFFSLLYFYYLIKKLPEGDLLKMQMFWVNAAVIFFFSGTLVLSFMRDYIVYTLHNDFAGFLTYRNFFKFGFCLVLTYASWLSYKSVQNPAKGS